MTDKQKRIYDALVAMDSDNVLNFILDYHGRQIFSNDFYEHLVDEGVIEMEGDEDDGE